MHKKIKKLKVSFAPNSEPVEQSMSDILLTQLMITIARVGLRADRISKNDDIIGME